MYADISWYLFQIHATNGWHEISCNWDVNWNFVDINDDDGWELRRITALWYDKESTQVFLAKEN